MKALNYLWIFGIIFVLLSSFGLAEITLKQKFNNTGIGLSYAQVGIPTSRAAVFNETANSTYYLTTLTVKVYEPQTFGGNVTAFVYNCSNALPIPPVLTTSSTILTPDDMDGTPRDFNFSFPYYKLNQDVDYCYVFNSSTLNLNTTYIGYYDTSGAGAQIQRLGNQGSDYAWANIDDSIIFHYYLYGSDSPYDVDLIHPNGETNNSLFNFTYNISQGMDNCSLWGDWGGSWHNNQTDIGVLESANPNYFSLIGVPDDGTYLWNVQCFNSSTEYWGLINYTFSMDTTPPDITLNPSNQFAANNHTANSPYDYTIYFNISVNSSDLSGFTINVTMYNGTTMYYYEDFTLTPPIYNYTNSTLTQSWTGGYHNVTIQAIDSYGNYNIQHNFFYLGRYNETPTSTVTTTLTNFTINVTYIADFTDINATLEYDGNIYTDIFKKVYSTYVIFYREVLAASVDTITQFGYAWNITAFYSASESIGGFFNLTQTVAPLSLDDCSTYTTPTLNVTFVDLNGNIIDTTYESNANYGALSNNLPKNYSVSGIATNFSFCIYPTNGELFSDFQFRYTNGTDYYNYYLINISLNNITQFLNLSIDTSPTSQVLFTLVDYNDDPISNAYLHVLKYNVGTNTYSTTEILKTDDSGETIGNIELIDGLYKFLVYKDYALIYQNPAGSGGIRILSNTRTFRINLGEASWYGNFETSVNAYTSLTFDNTTKKFTFTWSDPSGSMHYGCLKVLKSNRSREEQINDTCVMSTSGSIIQYIGTTSPTPGEKYVAFGYFKFDDLQLQKVLEFSVPESFKFSAVDTTGITLFMAFLITIGLALLGLPFPAISMILLGLGLFFTWILGLYAVSSILIVGLIVVIIMSIYKSGG